MAFAVFLHPKAAKTLENLDETLRKRIREQLKNLKEHPDRAGKQSRYSNFWSLRIGDYRAIYEIDREKSQVVVLFIGHRKKVYDDFSKMF
ncbi:MAG TPA: type II toxin-antitoxin system RelE/ParE family toxin [Candidatus Bathyarchaeia archaeon]|nr:type II toxin-antitoxin system RelE/ParE family toxin [Candidatus Bathyarchaeia archaeon]